MSYLEYYKPKENRHLGWIAFFLFLLVLIDAYFVWTNDASEKCIEKLDTLRKKQAELQQTHDDLRSALDKALEEKGIEPAIYDREADVSAYNVGDPNQTDSNPCVGASGHDICELLEWGVNVCAYNQVALGTKLELINGFSCIVLDRTSEEYAHRIDIAFPLGQDAFAWGVRRLPFRVIEE